MRRMWVRLGLVVALLAATIVGGQPATAGPSGGALPPVLIDVLQIGGNDGVPDDAAMIAATVTAVDPAQNGWIKAYPCDQDEPDTGNLNYVADTIANNLVLARLATDGTLCIATRAVTDYVIDLAGYVPAGSDITPLASPVRALDTRQTGPSPVPDGRAISLQLTGIADIPDTATLAVFNLTAVGGPIGGRVTAYPCDETPGTTSSVNFPADRNIANLVISRLSATGTVCFLTKNRTDIIVDVAAYATDGITTLPTPRRILDTRTTGQPAAGATTIVDPGLPDDATAAIYNLTAVGASGRGYATAHPCNTTRPTSSNLNYNGPAPVGAGSITKLAPSNTLCIYTKTPTHLIIDLIGYTTTDTTYTPITPTRIRDTREGWQSTCPWVLGEKISTGSFIAAYNVRTSRYLELRVPPSQYVGQVHSTITAIVTRDCTGIYYLGVNAVLRLGFDGSISSTPIPSIPGNAWGYSTYGTLHERPDGRVILISELTHDLATRDVLEPTFPSYLQVGSDGEAYGVDIGVSRSGDVVAVLYSGGSDRLTSFLVTYDGAGKQISMTELPVNASRLDVSPSGLYISVDTFGDDADSAYSVIYTKFGDVVDLVYGTDVLPVSQFIGNGELIVCVRSIGLFRWSLFGPIELVGDTSHPLLAGNLHCPTLGS